MPSSRRCRPPFANLSNLPQDSASSPSHLPSKSRPPRVPQKSNNDSNNSPTVSEYVRASQSPFLSCRTSRLKRNVENVASSASPSRVSLASSDADNENFPSPLHRKLASEDVPAACTPITRSRVPDVSSFSTPYAEAGKPSSSSSPCPDEPGRFIRYSRRKPAGPSHLSMSCPPPANHRRAECEKQPRNRRKLKRDFAATMFNCEENLQVNSKKSRRHSLPTMPSKSWFPEDFVATQRSHFAEVDAFELSEEEGDLSDEENA